MSEEFTSITFEWFRGETENLLHGLDDYRATMESQLVVAQRDEQKRIRERMQNVNEDREAEYDIARDEYVWTYEFMFPRSLRYSFVVLLFLVLENQLVGLCDEIKKRRNVPIRVNELKGDIIARSKTYLEKLAGIAGVNAHLWERLEDLSKVRNCIVHTMGQIDLSTDKKHLRQLVKSGRGLTTEHYVAPEQGILIIEPEFCAEATSTVRSFFDSVFSAYP